MADVFLDIKQWGNDLAMRFPVAVAARHSVVIGLPMLAQRLPENPLRYIFQNITDLASLDFG